MKAVKKLVTITLVGCIAITLHGCANAGVEINQLSPDTYQLTNPLAGIYNSLGEANKFCQSHGKEILVQSSELHMTIFQCLNRNDRDLKRTHYNPAPDILIKNVKD